MGGGGEPQAGEGKTRRRRPRRSRRRRCPVPGVVLRSDSRSEQGPGRQRVSSSRASPRAAVVAAGFSMRVKFDSEDRWSFPGILSLFCWEVPLGGGGLLKPLNGGAPDLARGRASFSARCGAGCLNSPPLIHTSVGRLPDRSSALFELCGRLSRDRLPTPSLEGREGGGESSWSSCNPPARSLDREPLCPCPSSSAPSLPPFARFAAASPAALTRSFGKPPPRAPRPSPRAATLTPAARMASRPSCARGRPLGPTTTPGAGGYG